VGVALARGFFEPRIKERYKPLPPALASMAEAAAAGRTDIWPEDARLQGSPEFREHQTQVRLALYDDWMLREGPPPASPRALVLADGPLFLARAERSLVAGNDEQRVRALKFLELSGSPDAVPVLEKAQTWAARRNLPELAAKIGDTLAALRSGAAPATAPAATQPAAATTRLAGAPATTRAATAPAVTRPTAAPDAPNDSQPGTPAGKPAPAR
jgi:hypothetical protein